MTPFQPIFPDYLAFPENLESIHNLQSYYDLYRRFDLQSAHRLWTISSKQIFSPLLRYRSNLSTRMLFSSLPSKKTNLSLFASQVPRAPAGSLTWASPTSRSWGTSRGAISQMLSCRRVKIVCIFITRRRRSWNGEGSLEKEWKMTRGLRFQAPKSRRTSQVEKSLGN